MKSEQSLVAAVEKSELSPRELNQKTADFANKITGDLENAKVTLIAETRPN